MRPSFAVLVLLLAACGRVREGTVDAGDACTSSRQCPINTTCLGTCVAECRTDEDCEFGHCNLIVCVQAPCPPSTCSVW